MSRVGKITDKITIGDNLEFATVHTNNGDYSGINYQVLALSRCASRTINILD